MLEKINCVDYKDRFPVILYFTYEKAGYINFPLNLKERTVMHNLDLEGLSLLHTEITEVWKQIDQIENPDSEEVKKFRTIADYLEDLDKRIKELSEVDPLPTVDHWKTLRSKLKSYIFR